MRFVAVTEIHVIDQHRLTCAACPSARHAPLITPGTDRRASLTQKPVVNSKHWHERPTEKLQYAENVPNISLLNTLIRDYAYLPKMAPGVKIKENKTLADNVELLKL